MPFAEIIVGKIQRDRSFKVFNLAAKRICQASQPTAVHPKGVILLFNVRRCNPRHVRHSADN